MISRTLRTAVIVAVLVGLTAGVGLGATGLLVAPLADRGPIALLIIGSDQGPPRSGSPLEGRADALHLLVVTEDRQQVSILDFPRDLYVDVPGTGTSRINACLNTGPDTCVETVQSLTGIDIDHWWLTDFRGLAAGVDLIGGLTLEVEQPLHDPFSGTDLDPGVQHLDGGQILAYSRDRKSRPQGDIDRTAAQTRVLRALHRKITDETSVTRVGELVANLRRTTVSNAGIADTLRLGFLALRIEPDEVTSAVVDGRAATAGDASILRLTDAGRTTIDDVADDGRLD